MKRRDFLRAGLFSAAAISGLGAALPVSVARAAHSATAVPRTLVNIMLLGGSDLRFAFVPDPLTHDAVYVDQFWTARSNIYRQGYADYATMYAAEYTTVSNGGFSFGIHNSCGWLIQEFNAGNVAIVCNVLGSSNRRHDHSQVIINTGDPTAGQLDTSRDGWGGRLVESAGTPNVVAVSGGVSLFCNGSNPDNRLAQVIHGKNMRSMALPLVDPNLSVTHSRNVTRRALIAYYKERGSEIQTEKPANWPYRRFFQHNDSLRAFGDGINTRLADHPMPDALGSLNLINNSFELQSRNLYDCCLTADILDLKVISMEYGGWDTHANQQAKMSGNLQDVLGTGGGLDTVSTQLAVDAPGANDSLVYMLSWDFGRQLAGNGTNGTDHGRGSYSVVAGNDVNGGVYGDMFPQREALPDPADSQGRTPFEIPGRDIAGLTSIERVYGRLSDWAASGTGSAVFPNIDSSALEAGVDLTYLLQA
jgi:uncharacterized protein (DUF1501 family)